MAQRRGGRVDSRKIPLMTPAEAVFFAVMAAWILFALWGMYLDAPMS